MRNVFLQLRAGMTFLQNDSNLHFKFFDDMELVLVMMEEQ